MIYFTGAIREFLSVALTAGVVLSWFPFQRRPRAGSVATLLAHGLVGVLFLAALHRFVLFLADQRLSSVSVLNTELIVNLASLLVAAAILIALIPVSAHLLTTIGKKRAMLFLAVLLVFASLQGGAEIALGLMAKGFWEATPARVSFVAKIGHLSPWMIYLETALFGLLLFAGYGKKRFLWRNGISGHERKSKYRILIEKRWLKAALGLTAAIVAPLLYQDLYAGRAPQLSPAVAVAPEPDGMIRLPVAEIDDGELHRFSAVSRSGKPVRFFVLNRGGETGLGVAFDACALCADKGYLKKGRHVICLACGSHILIPSIGRAGGCNPIPLQHEIRDGLLLIRSGDLDEGAKYFGSS